MSSRDRLHVLAYQSRKGSGLVSIIKITQISFGLLSTSGPAGGSLEKPLAIQIM